MQTDKETNRQSNCEKQKKINRNKYGDKQREIERMIQIERKKG